jgi:adenylate cyclase
VNAATFAITMQKEVAADQAQVPPDRRIVFRIGINLGDVVVEDGDLLGDGVNVAARLEQLCDHCGILISGTAYDHLHGKLDLPLEFTGEQHVKNISRLVRTYRIRLDGRYAGRRLMHSWLRQWHLPAAVALAFLAGGALLRWPAWESQAESATVEQITLSLPNEPYIAMLPFADFGYDPLLAYFVDGVAEDLIIDLSRPSGIIVIAANSSWTDKGKLSKAQKVAAELGARYVLTGSEEARIDQAKTKDPHAHEAILQGWARMRRESELTTTKASTLFEETVELDLGHQCAHATLATGHWRIAVFPWDTAKVGKQRC